MQRAGGAGIVYGAPRAPESPAPVPEPTSKTDPPTRAHGLHGGSQRFRIALLCDSLEDEFQAALVEATHLAASRYDLDTLVIPGGKLHHSSGKNFVYDLISAKWADGLIVAGHTIGHGVAQRDVQKFLGGLPPVPTVCLGVCTSEVFGVLVDNEQAAFDLTRHLAHEHRYQRIGFVGGSHGSPDSATRYSGFCRALGESGLEVNEHLVTEGDFTRESGRLAICELFDGRGVRLEDIDALVFANDAMAVGAYYELERRGIQIPAQLALVGFDDIEIARHLPAPLTTARQPLLEILAESVEVLVEAFRRQSFTPGMSQHSARVVTRRSCGCPRQRSQRYSSIPCAADATLQETLLSRVPLMRRDLDSRFAADLDELAPRWLEDLCETLVEQVEHAGRLPFYEKIEHLSVELLRHGRAIAGWQATLLLFRRHVSNVGIDILELIENILDGALLLASEIATSLLSRQKEELLEQLRALSDTTATLLAAPDMATVASAMHHHLPLLGVHTAVVSLLSEAEPTLAIPVAAVTPAGPLDLKPFSLDELAPSHLIRGRHFVLQPLGVRDEKLGLALLQSGMVHPSWYERLRDALSAALKGARLIDELRRAQDAVQLLAITDPLTGLNNRRYLSETMRRELAKSRSNSSQLSLLVLDLDGFKLLNDAYGHDQGDRALVLVANVLRECVRESDSLARYGGDEFVMLLPDTSRDLAHRVAARVLDDLPKRLAEFSASEVTCSIGIATTDQGEQSDEELFRLADQALLAAKHSGKNRAIHSREPAAS